MEGYVVLFVKVEPLVLKMPDGDVLTRFKATCDDLPGWHVFYNCESELEAFEQAKKAACQAKSQWEEICLEREKLNLELAIEFARVQREVRGEEK